MAAKPAVQLPGILAGAYIPSELTGLTVLQLKKLCKENKVSGYSKLGKNALIERLSGLASRAPGGHAGNAPVASGSCACPSATVLAITSPSLPPGSYKGHSHDLRRNKETPHPTSSAGPAPSALANADTSKVTTRPTGKSHRTTPSSLAIEC